MQERWEGTSSTVGVKQEAHEAAFLMDVYVMEVLKSDLSRLGKKTAKRVGSLLDILCQVCAAT